MAAFCWVTGSWEGAQGSARWCLGWSSAVCTEETRGRPGGTAPWPASVGAESGPLLAAQLPFCSRSSN